MSILMADNYSDKSTSYKQVKDYEKITKTLLLHDDSLTNIRPHIGVNILQTTPNKQNGVFSENCRCD